MAKAMETASGITIPGQSFVGSGDHILTFNIFLSTSSMPLHTERTHLMVRQRDKMGGLFLPEYI